MDLLLGVLIFIASTFLLVLYLAFGLICFIFMVIFSIIGFTALMLSEISKWIHDQFQESMLAVQNMAHGLAEKWKGENEGR